MKKGFSLVEILVVIAIFTVLSLIATQSLTLTIRGMKKTDNTTKVRESLDYSMGVIQRNLRNADSLTTICPNSDTSRIDYIDQRGLAASFSCVNIGDSGYIASASARLTSDSIAITSCSFSCVPGSANVPPDVVINITGKNAGTVTSETGIYDVSTRVLLRTY